MVAVVRMEADMLLLEVNNIVAELHVVEKFLEVLLKFLTPVTKAWRILLVPQHCNYKSLL